MKIILSALTCLFLFAALANAESWESPTEKRYGKQHPELYENFKRAKILLDGYGGYQSDLIKAKQLLDDIIAQQSDFAPAYREYARLYYNAGFINANKRKVQTLPLARAAIDKAIQMAPDYEDAYVLLGHQYVQEGLFQYAEEALDKAENLGTRTPWLHLNRVPIYRKKGNKAGVFAMYKKVVDSETDNRAAYSYALQGLAAFYRNEKLFSQADQWYKKHIEYDPKPWNIGEYARYLLYWRGDADNSILHGERAIAKMNYGVGRYNLACAYYLKWSQVAELEGKKKAKPYFDRAYELYSNLEEIIRRFANNRNLKKAGVDLQRYVSQVHDRI